MTTEKKDSPKLLGAGRSGKVYLIKTPEHQIARKIFDSDRTANLVHYVFSGAGNPYTWNEDAIRCAYYRRNILQPLVRMWFGDKVKISEAYDLGWNEDYKAYQLDTEFLKGRPVALCQPFSLEGDAEEKDLVHQVMKPMQQYLRKSGFDGLVWQAGKGNPVALNNFLLLDKEEGECRYGAIDLESGVPALFALNPLALFGYYIPKSFKHGAPLFDDADTVTLREYLHSHQAALIRQETKEGFEKLLEWTNLLEHHQKRWRSLGRMERGIQFQEKTGRITLDQADRYRRQPLQWFSREAGRLIVELLNLLFVILPLFVYKKVSSLPLLRWLQNIACYVSSMEFRLNMIRGYIGRRIGTWQKRKQMTEEEATYLQDAIDKESASDYLNDFSVHIGLKIVTKFFEFVLIPSLLVAGIINEWLALIWFVAGGPVYRTSYTGVRMFQLKAQGKPLPWIAFWLGLLPTVGDVAYPCQNLYLAGGKHGKVARFIIYDFFTRMGDKIPIWGGKDTQTEHFFNHGARWLIKAVERLHKEDKLEKRSRPATAFSPPMAPEKEH
ncbi:hypothetical protein BH24BAC1_BH24BAC1_12270 [soil metagenome]